MNDKWDRYLIYRELLWAMRYLDLLSHEQCQLARAECLKRLDEL